jgi:hypothetical protein
MSEQTSSRCGPPLVHCFFNGRFECECGAGVESHASTSRGLASRDRVARRPVPDSHRAWSCPLDFRVEFPERLISMSVFDAGLNSRDRIASVHDRSATRGSSIV